MRQSSLFNFHTFMGSLLSNSTLPLIEPCAFLCLFYVLPLWGIPKDEDLNEVNAKASGIVDDIYNSLGEFRTKIVAVYNHQPFGPFQDKDFNLANEQWVVGIMLSVKIMKPGLDLSPLGDVTHQIRRWMRTLPPIISQ
ncbi:hypothetical protein M8C21_015047, partial [Ambrosia artemisiifolia]